MDRKIARNQASTFIHFSKPGLYLSLQDKKFTYNNFIVSNFEARVTKTEIANLHKLYYRIGLEMGIDYEGTRYREFGVSHSAMYRGKESQLKALQYLSDLIAEEIDAERISFDESISDNEILEESGDVGLYENGQYLLEVGDAEIQIGKNATNKLEVLSDLTEGLDLHDSLDQRYENPPSRHIQDFAALQDELDAGKLPEEHREDLNIVLKEII